MSQQNEICDADWNMRPIFQRNQRLTPDRLNRIHEHHNERMRQLMLGVAGVGIVYGFAIKTYHDKQSDHYGHCICEHGKIYISCGLAIDCYGRSLYWPGGWVGISDIGGCLPEQKGSYTLHVHYAERRVDVDQRCGCDDADVDWVEEGVVFTLTPGCEKEKNKCPPLEEKCIERDGYICERLGAVDEHCIDPPECLENLCHVPPEPCATAPCDWLYSANSGLSLACVGVCARGDDKCEPALEFCPADPLVCHHRKYVYRNPLLFELIQGCDKNLARVSDLSIEDWLKVDSWENPIDWHEFSDRIKTKGIAIKFTKPILKSTLNPASIFVTAIVREQDSMFKDVLRLPVEKMIFLDESGDYALGVTLVFSKLWIANQIETDLSRFSFPFSIELTIRGAHLRDYCGDMLNALPLHFPKNKSEQAMPGNDFVVAFCVEPKAIAGKKVYEQDDTSYPAKQSFEKTEQVKKHTD